MKKTHSQFGNTYGGLTLIELKDGTRWLEMEDCFGPDYYGPLTDEQVAAFHVLLTVRDEPRFVLPKETGPEGPA